MDTCHLFATGYDIRALEVIKKVIKEVELKNIVCLHLNDSKRELGSRVDRHETIGKGAIGDIGFKHLLHLKELKDIPKILETPFKTLSDHKKNLDHLVSLI